MPGRSQPSHGRLEARIAAASARLHAKLTSLDLETVSEYNQVYLRADVIDTDGVGLRLYERLLAQAIANAAVPIEDVALVDYGGGHGAMSLLAKELGIGTVVYVDIYDVSCDDVRALATALDLRIDEVICGDLDDLIAAVRERGIRVDAVASYDVLEHIYDLEEHLNRLPALSDGAFRVIHASSANIENPRYLRGVMKAQRQAETETRSPRLGHKERDTLRSHRDIRLDMIRQEAPSMSPEDAQRLAVATRGLIQRDIERCVREFEQTGQISYRPDHPTNTCDPYTGNWAEHLVELGWLTTVAAKAGFTARVTPGLYLGRGGVPKRAGQAALNSVIRTVGRRAMPLAPYYVLELERVPAP